MIGHTARKPCPACRYNVKGNQLEASRLYCDPKRGGCGHFHRPGACPAIEVQKEAPVSVN